jgi:hypothetical protein
VFNSPKGRFFLKKLLIFLIFILTWGLFSPILKAAEFQFVGPLRRDILALAKEPLKAILEGRAPRAPSQGVKGLEAALPLVISVHVNNQLLARTWQLENPPPLQQAALLLGAQVLVDPKIGRPLTEEELPLATVSLAVLSNLKEVKDDKEILSDQAAIVFNGFKQSIGLPSDVPTGTKPQQLLNLTCQLAGLRPGAWLTSRSTIFSAQVSEVFEK